LATPAHQAIVFLAEYACADPLFRHSNRSSLIKIVRRADVPAPPTRSLATKIL
jgi:hypothetical protein